MFCVSFTKFYVLGLAHLDVAAYNYDFDTASKNHEPIYIMYDTRQINSFTIE